MTTDTDRKPKWADSGSVMIRTARKTWTCSGNGGRGEYAGHAEDCTPQIAPGAMYAEYLGDAAAYESGSRHCLACALFFGYIDGADLEEAVCSR